MKDLHARSNIYQNYKNQILHYFLHLNIRTHQLILAFSDSPEARNLNAFGGSLTGPDEMFKYSLTYHRFRAHTLLKPILCTIHSYLKIATLCQPKI